MSILVGYITISFHYSIAGIRLMNYLCYCNKKGKYSNAKTLENLLLHAPLTIYSILLTTSKCLRICIIYKDLNVKNVFTLTKNKCYIVSIKKLYIFVQSKYFLFFNFVTFLILHRLSVTFSHSRNCILTTTHTIKIKSGHFLFINGPLND